MDRQTAMVLAAYIQRGFGIIPTTLAEAQVLQGALASIQAVANGVAVMDVKPAGEPVQSAALASARKAAAQRANTK